MVIPAAKRIKNQAVIEADESNNNSGDVLISSASTTATKGGGFKMSSEKRIAALEEQLRQKECEIQALQVIN